MARRLVRCCRVLLLCRGAPASPVIEVPGVVREFGSIVPAPYTPPCIVPCATTTGSSLPVFSFEDEPAGLRALFLMRASGQPGNSANCHKPTFEWIASGAHVIDVVSLHYERHTIRVP